MSECEKYIEMISELVDGELTQQQEAELRTHIDMCADCARVYEAFSGISDAIADELVMPPETLAKGIMYKIKVQNKSGAGKRFAFGRFTAFAACLALVLFGASHFGLLGSVKSSSEETAAAPKALNESEALLDASMQSSYYGNDEEGAAVAEGETTGNDQNIVAGGAPQAALTDGTVLQFGFPTQSMVAATGLMAQEEREPNFLFDAKEIQVFEGKYYLDEKSKDKNKLLFSLTSEKDLNAFVELLTALPEESAEYSAQDGEILENDPMYTLVILADKENDEAAKDKLICVWFVDGKMWCAISDAEIPLPDFNDDTEKILYKAEGTQEKFEKRIKENSK